MLLSALLVATTLSQTPAPQMRVTVHDLDFNRREDVSTFIRRTRVASRRYCARHIAFITPDRMGTPAVCEQAMASLTFEALPQHARESLIRSGQSRWFR